MNRTLGALVLILSLLFGACKTQPDSATASSNKMAPSNPGIVSSEEPGSPFIAFNIWLKIGSQNDPTGKQGLASLTGRFLAASATTQLSYEDIRETLYPMAARYSARTDKEMTSFFGQVHKDNLEAFYAIFKQVLLSPAFNEEDFNRVKSQTLNYLTTVRRFSNDEELGKELLSREIFRGTTYEHPEEGYVTSVNSITLDDVKAFYKTHFLAGNLVVGLGGGYPAGFAERVRADFDTLPAGGTASPSRPVPAPIDGVHVLIVEKDTNATAISFGYPIDLLRSDSDFPAMMLANSWLGEHRSGASHLYNVIRSTRGMNYGDYSYIEAYPMGNAVQIPPVNVARHKQIFQIWIRPISMLKPGDMHDRSIFAFRAAMRELGLMIENGLNQTQFETARDFLINYTVNFGATVSRRLAYRIDDRFYGLDQGFLASIKPNMTALDAGTVNAAIKKHLQPNNMWVVFITADAQKLKEKLVSGAPTPIQYSGDIAQEVLDEDKIIESFSIPIKPENVHIIAIDEVFEN